MRSRSRIIFSLFSLVFGAALVFGGFTLAWFTDEATPSTNPAWVVGTVDYEVSGPGFETTQESTSSKPVKWEPGECKEFSWTFTNTGTKSLALRARVIEEYHGSDGSETAWAEGQSFNPCSKNWAMYFTFQRLESPKTVDLIAGRHYTAGSVSVRVVDGKLEIRIKTTGDWRMSESHVHVRNSLREFPLKGNKNPVPGQFDHKAAHALVDEYTYTITPDKFRLEQKMYIAVHAVVRGMPEQADPSPVAWSPTNAGRLWTLGNAETLDGETVYWWYHCGPVKPEESVTLDLTGCLDADSRAGTYIVQLETEAAQASNQAIDVLWPLNPCGSGPDA